MDEFHSSIIIIKNWLLLFVFGFKWNSKNMTYFSTPWKFGLMTFTTKKILKIEELI